MELAARERLDSTVEQLSDAERQRHLLHAARHAGRWLASVLERQRDLGMHAAHDHLCLGVLQQRAAGGCQVARPMFADAQARHTQLAGGLAAVEVRDEPARRPQQGRLARAGLAAYEAKLARLERE